MVETDRPQIHSVDELGLMAEPGFAGKSEESWREIFSSASLSTTTRYSISVTSYA